MESGLRVLAFDIETIPDVDLGRELYGLEGVDDEDVAKAMEFRRLQKSGSEFLQLHQHRIVAIAVAWRNRDEFKVWSLGDADSGERELLERFFGAVEKFVPDLVSWNGSGFDLPVMHYRSMLHGVQSPQYWETGDEQQSFRFNNYLSRYHGRHTDVMDVVAGYQPRAWAGLDEVAVMLGFPGKMGMEGAQVWQAYLSGRIADIRNYCETDALNTYLVWLKYQFMRGRLDSTELAGEFDLVRTSLKALNCAHFDDFLKAWRQRGEG